MTARIGDLAHHQRLTTLVVETNKRIRDAQLDIASGVRARRWDEIGDRAALLVSTREQRALVERLLAENEKVRSRLAVVDAALGGIAELAERFRTLLVARLGEPGRSSIPLDVEVDQMAKELASLLNRQVDGAFLFSGSRTDRPAVALPDPLPTEADPSLYYLGDSVELSLRVGPDLEVRYGTTAAAAPFAELFAALGLAREAHLADDRAGLEEALTSASAALEGVADERGRLGVVAARLESIAEGQRGALVELGELASAIADTDLAEAASRLARDQSLLEATYLVVARLAQLSLADYLR